MVNPEEASRPEIEAQLNTFFTLADSLVPANYDRPLPGMPVADQPEFPLARINGEQLAARSEEVAEAARRLKIGAADEVELSFALPVTVQSRDRSFDALSGTATLQINRPNTGHYDIYSVEQDTTFDAENPDLNAWHSSNENLESMDVMEKLVVEEQIETTVERLGDQPLDDYHPLVIGIKAVLRERREKIDEEVDGIREIEFAEAEALVAIARTLVDRGHELASGQA